LEHEKKTFAKSGNQEFEYRVDETSSYKICFIGFGLDTKHTFVTLLSEKQELVTTHDVNTTTDSIHSLIDKIQIIRDLKLGKVEVSSVLEMGILTIKSRHKPN